MTTPQNAEEQLHEMLDSAVRNGFFMVKYWSNEGILEDLKEKHGVPDIDDEILIHFIQNWKDKR